MVEKVTLFDKEYEVQNLGDKAKILIKNMQFTTSHINNLNNMQALLIRAKNSYLESLKNEMITNKAGLNIGDE